MRAGHALVSLGLTAKEPKREPHRRKGVYKHGRPLSPNVRSSGRHAYFSLRPFRFPASFVPRLVLRKKQITAGQTGSREDAPTLTAGSNFACGSVIKGRRVASSATLLLLSAFMCRLLLSVRRDRRYCVFAHRATDNTYGTCSANSGWLLFVTITEQK